MVGLDLDIYGAGLYFLAHSCAANREIYAANATAVPRVLLSTLNGSFTDNGSLFNVLLTIKKTNAGYDVFYFCGAFVLHVDRYLVIDSNRYGGQGGQFLTCEVFAIE